MKKKYGLVGFPLSHSFSQKYFTEKFQKENIDAEYLNVETESIVDLKEKLHSLQNVCGINVTIPHKKSVIALLDEQHEVVEKIQACNCIKIEHGRWKGFNTDVIGFEKTFRKYYDKLKHTSAFVFGSGGASLAVVYVLDKMKIPFTLITRQHGEMTIPFQSQYFKGFLHYDLLTKQELMARQIFINTTPLGMYPNTEDSPLKDFSFVTSAYYFYDLIYNPAETFFLHKAKQQGAIIANGYEMLEIQAEESYKIWTKE